MKKVGLTALGIVAACAACCAIPLAVPIVGALSTAGLASLYLDSIHMGDVAAVTGFVASAVGFAWIGSRFLARRHKPCTPLQKAASCSVDGNAVSASCACSRGTS